MRVRSFSLAVVYQKHGYGGKVPLFPSWMRKGELVVIDCGMDESLSSAGILVVSALVGQSSMMARLSKIWQRDLEAFGVDFFHAKEHWNKRSRAYHGLSNAKRRQLLLRLIDHVRKFSYRGISVSIRPEEYKTWTTNRFRSNWGAAYSFAIQMLMLLIYQDLEDRKRTHEIVNFLLEDGHPNANQALDIISGVGNTKRPFLNLGTFGRGGKLNNPSLQAADLLAYGNCQFVSNGDSRIYRQLVGRTEKRFFRLECNRDLVDLIKQEINSNFDRRRELRLKGSAYTL
jgi:hypothetical protein